ncbi:hypothetical protein KSP39_PZI024105 [Platanthera zijinensis]|uniref:Uncharacterized protein n=1 Tax=Platanthera zijinensis TaxID=2320716 RepID=A0AAP0FT32_9ASPA
MEEEPRRRTFTEAPSFGKTAVFAEMDRPEDAGSEIIADEGLDIDDFEFSFTPLESKPVALPAATPAGEIFSNGRILPVYPVFNQSLVAGDLEALVRGELTDGMGRLALSLEDVDLEGLRGSEAPYCIWEQKSAPQSPPQSPDRWRKSNSTGSLAEEFTRFRIRDLILGRSRSNEKEVPKRSLGCPARPGNKAAPATETEKKGKNGNENGGVKGGTVKELDAVQAYRIYYGKGAAGRQRRFLPFRRDLLVGFFG